MFKQWVVLLFVFGLILGDFAKTAYANDSIWFPTSGVNGGHVNDIAVDPTNSNIIYLATDNGVFRSTTSGQSWFQTSVGMTQTVMNAIAINPQATNILYAGSVSGAIYKSTNGGLNWLPVLGGTEPPLDNSINTLSHIVVDPVVTSTVYVALRSAVLISTDSGATWNTSLFIANLQVSNLVMDTGSSQILYAGSNQGVWKAVSGGGWGLTSFSSSVTALAVMPSLPATAYAASQSGLMKTTDGGTNWVPVTIPAGMAPPNVINELAVNPQSPNTLYAGIANFTGQTLTANLFKSTDGGTTWVSVATGAGNPVVYAINFSPSTVYVGTYGGGIFSSANAGVTWEKRNNGLIGATSKSITSVPTNSSLMFAATEGSGIFKSTDGGTSWLSTSAGITSTHIFDVAVDHQNANIVYASGIRWVYKSTDGGTSWSNASVGLVDPFDQLTNIDAVVVHPLTNTFLFAGTNVGVFTSTNAAGSWTRVASAPSLVSDLVVGIQSASKVLASSYGGVFISNNSGVSWSQTFTGNVSALAVNPVTPTIVYAATSEGVQKSINGGTSWSPKNDGLPVIPAGSNSVVDVTVDPANPNTVYVALNYLANLYYGKGGVFVSTDGGENWNSLNTGLSRKFPTTLFVRPGATSRLFAGFALEGIKFYSQAQHLFLPLLQR